MKKKTIYEEINRLLTEDYPMGFLAKNGEGLQEMFCNPIYVGIGKYPRLIEPQRWIRVFGKIVKEIGTEEALATMLVMLRYSFYEEELERRQTNRALKGRKK